jgi:hypothetical protein
MPDEIAQNGVDLTRRDFAKLTLAALAGFSAGSGANGSQPQTASASDPILSEPHICRGLNTCRGRAVSRHNQCAGTSTCATARYHPCKGHNDCRGQGGCGDLPGGNECRGLGACDVPLKPRVWPLARKRFEQVMKQQRRRFGVPPLVAQNQ